MNRNVPALTGLRFLAAMYVVAFHFARPTNAILSCGYLGVGVFFVLSGFILAYVYGRTPERPFDRASFWSARFARVYPLYLLSFLLAAPAYISHRVMSDPSAASRFAKIGIGAATYLGLAQAWIPGATHIWNSVAWTLSVETFFYAVFPFVVGPLARVAGRRLFIGLAGVWIADLVPAALFLFAGPFNDTVQTFVQEVPLLQFPAFLFGVLLGHRYLRDESGERSAWMIYAGATGTLLAAAYSRFIPPVLLHNGLLLPFFGMLIYGLAKGGLEKGKSPASWLASRPMVLLGEASYGMYLLQYPVWWAVLWLSRNYRLEDYVTDIHTSRALSDPKVFCAGVIVLIGLSVLTLRYIETPARRWLRSRAGSEISFPAVPTRARACIILFVCTILVRLALLPILPIPTPQVHDEFSYLYGADTFASGRVTNPQHPLWVFFESFHIIQHPTGQSKYPPLQAAFLAVGERFLGHPWYGALLGAGLLSAAMCWMLQGWFSPGLALFGAAASAGYIGVLSYWTNSYWGGTLSALGGCLVLGAMRRLVRRATPGDAFAGALGVAILSNSRPFEGMCLTVAASVTFVCWMRVEHRSWKPFLRAKILIPAGAILAAAALWTGYYNFRVTGHPGLMPYQLHESQYAVTTAFRFQPQTHNSPIYHHKVLEQYWKGWEVRSTRDSAHFNYRRPDAAGIPGAITAGGSLIGILAAAGLLAWRNPGVRFALLTAVLFGIGLSQERTILLHYASPGLGLLFILFLFGFRFLRAARPNARISGRVMARGMAILVFLGMGVAAWSMHRATHIPTVSERRDQVEARLSGLGGQHLVIVQYSDNHNVHEDWVYNRADIDHADVVWARDMGAEMNRALLAYFPKREAWVLQADDGPEAITPYAAGDRTLTRAQFSDRRRDTGN